MPGEIFRRRPGQPGEGRRAPPVARKIFFPNVFSFTINPRIFVDNFVYRLRIGRLKLCHRVLFLEKKKKKKRRVHLGDFKGEKEERNGRRKYFASIDILFFQLRKAKLFRGYFCRGGGEGGGEERFCRDKIFSIIQSYIFIRNEIRRWKICANIKVPFQKYLIFKSV